MDSSLLSTLTTIRLFMYMSRRISVKIDIEGDEAVLMRGEANRRVASNKRYPRQALRLVNENLEIIKLRWEELHRNDDYNCT